MLKRWNELEKMLVLSVAFTLVLLSIRIIATAQLYYIFYAWNLFLAAIPLLISRKLFKHDHMSWKVVLLLFCWLMFLPNAPYIITDIFHFTERPPVPLWVDLMLVTSAAWNGLLLGIISLLQVEHFLTKFISRVKVNLVITASLMLSAFGVYMGRYLRFNTWDVIANPDDICRSLFYRVLYPQENLRTWGFTLLCGCMLCVIYFTIKEIPLALSMGSRTKEPGKSRQLR